jgi:hypothetical protein
VVPPDVEPDPPSDDPVLVVEESPDLVDDSPPDPVVVVSDPAPSDPVVDASRDLDRAAVPRSFFAQPLPLKWIVGGANALRTGDAPQIGHAVGPSAVTEWMTSKR